MAYSSAQIRLSEHGFLDTDISKSPRAAWDSLGQVAKKILVQRLIPRDEVSDLISQYQELNYRLLCEVDRK